MRVTYLILTWNRRDALTRHLDLLMRQTYPDPFEVIVCVDGSTDGTQQMLSNLKSNPCYSLRWFDTGSIDKNTAAKARNLGIKNAAGEILIMADDDCLPHKDLIKKYVENFNPQEIQLGHKSCNQDFLNMGLPVPIEPGNPEIWDRTWKAGTFCFFQSGSCAMATAVARTRARDGSIGFDERFVGYGHEDSEFGYRLHGIGFKLVFNADAVTWHMNPGDAPQQDTELKRIGAINSDRLLHQILEEPLWTE